MCSVLVWGRLRRCCLSKGSERDEGMQLSLCCEMSSGRRKSVSVCASAGCAPHVFSLCSSCGPPAVLQVRRCVGSSAAGLGAECAAADLVAAVALQGAEPLVAH